MKRISDIFEMSIKVITEEANERESDLHGQFAP